MKKAIIISLSIFFSPLISNSQDRCKEVFKAVYQVLKVNSERDYLETLYQIYQSTNQREVDTKTANSGNIIVPKYGTADWDNNKSKVTRTYNSTDWTRITSLSEKTKLELTKTYYDPTVATRAIEAWEKCIPTSTGLPQITHQSDRNSVIIKLQMNMSTYREKWQKVQVRQIVSSSNLKIDTTHSGFKAGDSLFYNGSYILSFTRIDSGKSAAFVSISLSEGDLPTERIYPIEKEPVYEIRIENRTIVYDVELNVSANWMKVFVPNNTQIIRFKNDNNCHPIDINSLITNLKYRDIQNIKWIFAANSGSFCKLETRDNGEQNSFLTLNGILNVKKNVKSGRIIITYDAKTSICTNCD